LTRERLLGTRARDARGPSRGRFVIAGHCPDAKGDMRDK
jgi:hypothetical protein